MRLLTQTLTVNKYLSVKTWSFMCRIGAHHHHYSKIFFSYKDKNILPLRLTALAIEKPVTELAVGDSS